MSALRSGVPVRPYYRKTINAGSAVKIGWNSRDGDLNAVELSSARYRIDNLTDSLVIQDWTTISAPAAKGTVTIPASKNGMSRTYRDRELRQVTFELTDTDGNVSQQLAYYELAAVFQGAA